MYNLAVRSYTSPSLLALSLKIFIIRFLTQQLMNLTPIEPEADMLPSKPVWQTIYMKGVHKVNFPLVPQLLNLLMCEVTACT